MKRAARTCARTAPLNSALYGRKDVPHRGLLCPRRTDCGTRSVGSPPFNQENTVELPSSWDELDRHEVTAERTDVSAW
jgi:hypothetical protein